MGLPSHFPQPRPATTLRDPHPVCSVRYSPTAPPFPPILPITPHFPHTPRPRFGEWVSAVAMCADARWGRIATRGGRRCTSVAAPAAALPVGHRGVIDPARALARPFPSANHKYSLPLPGHFVRLVPREVPGPRCRWDSRGGRS